MSKRKKNFIIFGFGPIARFIAEQLITKHNAFVVMVDSKEENLHPYGVFHKPFIVGEKFDFIRKYTVAALNRPGLNLAWCEHISSQGETEQEHLEKRGIFFRWIDSVANETRIGKFDRVLFSEENEHGLPLSADEIDSWLLVLEPHLAKVLAPQGKTIVFGVSCHPSANCPLNILCVDDQGSADQNQQKLLAELTKEEYSGTNNFPTSAP